MKAKEITLVMAYSVDCADCGYHSVFETIDQAEQFAGPHSCEIVRRNHLRLDLWKRNGGWPDDRDIDVELRSRAVLA